MAPKCDKCVGRVGPLLGHGFAPFRSEVGEEGFDCLICIAEVVFVEILDVLFLDAVDDTLNANVSDCLLEVKLLL